MRGTRFERAIRSIEVALADAKRAQDEEMMSGYERGLKEGWEAGYKVGYDEGHKDVYGTTGATK